MAAEDLVEEVGSSPRSMAKTPKLKKEKYTVNSLSGALPDPVNSANIGTIEVKREMP